jgi:hypothetical protein
MKNYLITIIIILPLFSCESNEPEDLEINMIKVKREAMSQMINQYKAYGVEPTEEGTWSDKLVLEADLEELKNQLEATKSMFENLEKRKNSPQALLNKEYAEKFKNAKSKEEEKLLWEEFEEKHRELDEQIKH